MPDSLIDFVLHHIDDEWDRLLKEFSCFSRDEFSWQPVPDVHSIGWHVRHVIDWRYALVHVLIGGNLNQEPLTCLGWEHEPLIQEISSNQGWYEPVSTVEETMDYLQRVREITKTDIRNLPASRYWEKVVFPWRTNRLLDEVFQDIRHSSLHRGHIREIRKAYAPGNVRVKCTRFDWTVSLPNHLRKGREVSLGTTTRCPF